MEGRDDGIVDYPLDALREAIINALIHRDYFESSSDIQIRVYDDRVTISNPGTLPSKLKIKDLKREGHLSVPRNPLLAQGFYFANFIERWGYGMIDCQMKTAHLASLGAREIPRAEFSQKLAELVNLPGINGAWHQP